MKNKYFVFIHHRDQFIQETNSKGCEYWKVRDTSSFVVVDMIIYDRKLRRTTDKLLELIKNVQHCARYKIN